MFNNSEISNLDLVRTIYSTVAWVVCIPGMLLNLILLWIVCKKTPKLMLDSRSLLMTPCIIGFIIAIWTFIVQPIPIVFHGYHAVVQNGYFRNANQFTNYTANTLWFQFLFIFLCVTTLMFVYRYYMAFGNGIIPKTIKFGATSIVLFLLFIHIALHYWSDYPFDFYKPDMERLAILVQAEIGITDIRFSSFCYARSFSWMMHCLVMVVLFTLCYIIIIYCFVKTNMYFNKNSEYNSSNKAVSNERILKCQKQVTRALCLQAILPTINVTELVLQTTLLPVLFPGVHIIHVMVYAAIPLYCIPLLNPFIIILTVKPYWRAILSIIPGIKNTRIYASTHGTIIATPSTAMPLSSFVRRE